MINSEFDREARQWGMICHLAALVGYLIPFGNIIGPFIVWQIKKEESPFIDFHGREAVNFQICYTIYLCIALLLMVVFVGFFLAPMLILVQVILMIIAAVKASSGEYYQYPFIFRCL
tara:strand:- start:1071 stop:1421 length:351 start_codon:yes stop_codon:yes gene_type:complete